MKNTLSSLLLLISFSLFAQVEKLDVTYSSKLILAEDTDLSSIISSGGDYAGNPEIKKMIIQKLTEPVNFKLIIQNNLSVYTEIEKVDNTQKSSGVNIQVIGSKEQNFKDIDTKQFFKSANLGNKQITVKDDLKNYNWIVSRDTKTILGYEAKKAIGEYKNKKIIAWFTTSIPYKTGPADYWGLPGLILEIEEDANLSDKIEAKKVTRITDVTTINDKKTIEIPKSNKYLSENEFVTKRDELIKNMKDMYSNGVDTGN